MSIGSFLFGTKPQAKYQTVPNYDPSQMALFNEAGSYLSGQIGRTPTMSPYAKNYQNFLQNYPEWARKLTDEVYSPGSTRNYLNKVIYPQWEKYTAPQIGEQYAGNYYSRARAKAVTDSLNSTMAQGNEAYYGLNSARENALNNLLSQEPTMSGELINQWDTYNNWAKSPAAAAMLEYLRLKPYTTQWYMEPGKKGAITPLMTAGGAVVGGYAGGPMGAVAGANIGNSFGSYFQR